MSAPDPARWLWRQRVVPVDTRARLLLGAHLEAFEGLCWTVDAPDGSVEVLAPGSRAEEASSALSSVCAAVGALRVEK